MAPHTTALASLLALGVQVSGRGDWTFDFSVCVLCLTDPAPASLVYPRPQQQSPSQPIDEAIVRTVMHTCTVVAGVAPVLAAQPPVRSICTEIERALHELTRRMSAAVRTPSAAPEEEGLLPI